MLQTPNTPFSIHQYAQWETFLALPQKITSIIILISALEGYS